MVELGEKKIHSLGQALVKGHVASIAQQAVLRHILLQQVWKEHTHLLNYSVKWSQPQACCSSRGILTMLSDVVFEFWVVLYGSRSWTQWSLWVLSNSGYSVTA